MLKQPRWAPEASLPIITGLVWLWYGSSFGIFGFICAVIPGCLLTSSGFSALLYPGDIRIPQFAALGGLLGVPLALPAAMAGSPLLALVLGILSALSFIAAGALSVRQEPHTDQAPEPERSLRLATEVAIDDAVLASMNFTIPLLIGGDHPQIRHEAYQARELFAARGWLEQPDHYHRPPPPLENPKLRSRRSAGIDFEQLSFSSDYEPHPEEPGRERWLDYAPNRTAHGWILRHSDASRPWLVCIHGYTMGVPHLDLTLFRAPHLHQKLGLNLLFPILPFHGPRKVQRWHGKGFLSGDIMDTVHAEAQAIWDMRRLLAWLRTRGATRIGLYGISLGGYNGAMLASLEADLACGIVGVPASDFSRLTWRHGPPLQLRYGEHHGLVHDVVGEVLEVVSPLALTPRISKERRYIFGATGDRFVTPDQIRNLWRHWDQPRILWYQGAHLSFNMHPEVQTFLDQALVESEMVRR